MKQMQPKELLVHLEKGNRAEEFLEIHEGVSYGREYFLNPLNPIGEIQRMERRMRDMQQMQSAQLFGTSAMGSIFRGGR